MATVHACIINFFICTFSSGWALHHNTGTGLTTPNITVGNNLVETLNDDTTTPNSGILLFYTMSGEQRHLDSLCYNAKLLSREGVPNELKKADVLVYDNGGATHDIPGMVTVPQIVNVPAPNTRKEEVKKCLEMFKGSSKQHYMTSKNVGYRMGAVQAVDAMLHDGFLDRFQWVIHLHPDIFIVNPLPLLKVLQEAKNPAVTSEFSKGPDKVPKALAACYTFNFFSFQPARIHHNAFSAWKDYQGPPECYLRDRAFKDVSLTLVPHDSNKHYDWAGVDEFGLWHEHNLAAVVVYIAAHATI